jgi:transcriptional regulator GlxA family with amidase domain
MSVPKRPIKTAILAYERCTSTIVLGLMDIFTLANDLWSTGAGKGTGLFDVGIVTTSGRAVRCFNGHPIHPHGAGRVATWDLVFIPGFLGDMNAILHREKRTVHWMREQHRHGARIAAVCTGNFLLAETGLLAGKTATTHWSQINAFRTRFPDVRLEPEKILVDNGTLVSAAGVTAYLNLALHLLAIYGSTDLASACAKIFLVDGGRKVQTPYEMFSSPKGHGDEEVKTVQEWLEAHFKEKVTAQSLGMVCALDERTLARRFKSATGDTPMQYLQRLRVENAKRLLESGSLAFSKITWRVGYEDISSFQRLFTRYTGLPPGAYRKKFAFVSA